MRVAPLLSVLCASLCVSALVLPIARTKQRLLRAEKERILRALNLEAEPTHRLTAVQRANGMAEEDGLRKVDSHDYEPVNREGKCLLYQNTEVPDCYQFTYENYGDIHRAELVLDFEEESTREDVSVVVKELSDWAEESWLLSKIFLKSWRGGNVSIPITDHVRLWMDESGDESITSYLQISSRSSASGRAVNTLKRPPTLRITFVQKVDRIERASDCDAESPCCMQNFYVNFTEIGWSDWIISPQGYWSNYCLGQCDVDAPHPDRLTNVLLRHASSNNSEMFIPPPSCAPTQYGSLRLLYAAGPNEVRSSVLHGMKVLACGCHAIGRN